MAESTANTVILLINLHPWEVVLNIVTAGVVLALFMMIAYGATHND